MSKNILVSGLVLGKETEMCPCNNINIGWLFSQPTDLLWVDKIFVTQNEWQVIVKNPKTAFAAAGKLVFERLQAEGLIKTVPDTTISNSRANEILSVIEKDLQYIKDLYTENEDENDPIMTMGNYHFCIPSLWTLYAAIELSMKFHANFSLLPDELAYLTALIPRKYKREIQTGRKIAIDEVLSVYLPSIELGHAYLIDSEKGRCSKCSKYVDCSNNYLTQIEKQLESIMKLRQYDEIRQTCEVMDKICERSEMLGHVLSGNELWEDLLEEAERTEKAVKHKLSKIKWWSKVSTYATIGIGAVSFLHPIIGVGTVIPTVAEQALSSYEKRLKKEVSWVSFINNPDSLIDRNRIFDD